MRYLARDSFARSTSFSKREYHLPSNRGCTECGAIRHTKTGRPYLYRYGSESDGIRPNRHFGNPFCSISCARTYGKV